MMRLQQSLPPDSKLLAHCGTRPTTRPVGSNQVSVDQSSSSRCSKQRSLLIILVPRLRSPNTTTALEEIFLEESHKRTCSVYSDNKVCLPQTCGRFQPSRI